MRRAVRSTLMIGTTKQKLPKGHYETTRGKATKQQLPKGHYEGEGEELAKVYWKPPGSKQSR